MADDGDAIASRAMREQTSLSPVEAREVIDALLLILRHPKANFRTRTSAARELLRHRALALSALRAENDLVADAVQEQLDRLEERHHD